jgi:glycosyltransferase involved in cell wall biosynthesis
MPDSLSVIIPTYNRSDLLVEAVRSVQRQTVQEIEIIVVDDGSTKPVANRLQGFKGAVRVLRQENSGLNAARNAGLRAARGDFIALLDDDDLWLPFKTEIQMTALERFPEAGFVFSDFSIFDEKRLRTENGLSTWNDLPGPWQTKIGFCQSARELGLLLPPSGRDFQVWMGSIYHQMLYEPYVLPSTALIKRTAIAGAAPFPIGNIHCGDWQFFAEMTRRAPCVFLSLPTVMNRSHNDAVRLTRQSPIIRLQDRLKLIDQVWREDTAFMETYGHEVDRVEGQQLSRLALLCLLEDRREEALEYLSRRRRLSGAGMWVKDRLLYFGARLPFSPQLLRMLRWIKSMGRM